MNPPENQRNRDPLSQTNYVDICRVTLDVRNSVGLN